MGGPTQGARRRGSGAGGPAFTNTQTHNHTTHRTHTQTPHPKDWLKMDWLKMDRRKMALAKNAKLLTTDFGQKWIGQSRP